MDQEVRVKRTVTEDKFSDASKVHGNTAKEVVVTTQTNQTLWSDCTLEPT
jgi:hypothetical protein